MTSWHKNLQQAKQRNINFNRLFEICIITILFLTIAYFLVYPITHNFSLARLIWMPGFILMICSCIICISQHNKALEPIEILGFLIVATVTVSGVILAGLGSSLIFSAGAFLTLLMAMWFYSGVRISRKLFDMIYYTGVVLSVLFIIYSFTPIATKAYLRGEFVTSSYFTFNLDNANTTATYLYGIMCILLVNFPVRGNIKFLNAVLIAIDFYFIYRTNSRSCLMAAIFAIAFLFITTKKKVPSLIVVLAWLIPIIFVFIYLYMYNAKVDDIVIFNKSLFSGRESVYKDYLAMINGVWEILFGDMKSAGFQNAHNAPLAIFCSIGVVGAFISEILFLLSVLRINTNSRVSTLCVISIIGFFIHSCAEAHMFMGGFPGSVFMIIFYLLANYSAETDNQIVLF